MRIVFILNTLGVGGAERQVLGLAERMSARGHAVRLLVLLAGGGIEREWNVPAGIEVCRLGITKTPWGFLRGFARGVRELRGFGPEVLHSHNFHGNIVARLLRIFAPRARVIATIHNVYEGGAARMMAYRLTDGLAARTIAVSEAARERYVRMGAVAARKSGVILNGIELGDFVPDATERERVREEMDAGGDFVWIATGRLAAAKDYPTMLRAFARVKAGERAQLWIAGTGEDAYAAELRVLAEELRVTDAVRWLGLRRDVPALLDAADGYALASAWEGMPLALGEAMAMAKPVVATDVGGVSEMLGGAGMLVRAGDSDVLAETMLGVMRMGAAERKAMGRAARARVREKFDMDGTAAEWEAVYREVVCGPGEEENAGFAVRR